MTYKNLLEATKNLPAAARTPKLHVVLGSGLAGALDSVLSASKGWQDLAEVSFLDLQSIPHTSVVGHKGSFRFVTHKASGATVVLQTGRLHGYEGHEPTIVVAPLVESFDLGCRTFLLTNAAGSLQRKWGAGSAMVITDHVNLTGKNPLIGANPRNVQNLERGPRFPDMSTAYSPTLSKLLKRSLKAKLKNVYEGTYLGVLGPSFETPAEVRLFSQWGLGAVGMSTVWETIALKHMGADVAGLSFLSNLGAGLSKSPLSHEEVLETGKKSADLLMRAILDFAEAFVGGESSPKANSPKKAPAKAQKKKTKK
ncbi:MAG TPA: purine-nucleoside phosphorylase [Bdellovibrionota bacterium]|jgi:inosine/guanosine/xanthosine phosphorylase family protein|nr:purine-nucleoside phosphorylase [Bdellovibrionota bacterium]